MDGSIGNQLISDGEIAEHLSMSKSWVRQQRWLRRKGEPHFLKLDPVMIGTSPRYRADDLNTLLNEVIAANDNAVGI